MASDASPGIAPSRPVQSVDIAIIGAGPAGMAAAIAA